MDKRTLLQMTLISIFQDSIIWTRRSLFILIFYLIIPAPSLLRSSTFMISSDNHASEAFLSRSVNQLGQLLTDVQYGDLTENQKDALREYIIKLKEFKYE